MICPQQLLLLPGTVSIMTMVVIGYDRYNVIVKGFSGTKITGGKAFVILLCIWTYGILGCCPPFFGWGGYSLGTFFKSLQLL
jgi:r-opsin